MASPSFHLADGDIFSGNMVGMNIIGFTGHRQLHDEAFVVSALRDLIPEMVESHSMVAGACGMAWGADLDFADAVVDVGADLWAFIPFPSQADRWGADDRERRRRLLSSAASSTTFSDVYDISAYRRRDEAIVRSSTILIAALDGNVSGGGTFWTARFARSRGLPVFVVDSWEHTVTTPDSTLWDSF